MKAFILFLLTGTGILCPAQKTGEFRESLSREFTLSEDVSNARVHIYNFSGFIHVEGTEGRKVIMEIDKTISSETSHDLETGKKDLKLAFGQSNDSIIAYMEGPFDTRPGSRNFNFNDDEPEYEFTTDFTVKVPSGVNLIVSTVTEGNIEIRNVNGKLCVNNVNEGIIISNARSSTYAHTVNGNVEVTYAANPAEESSYETINGDISITYKPGFSADITFKSMNGDLFTDFQDAALLPVTATKVRERKSDHFIYKLNKTTTVRFGKGGKTFSFETLNGDVYIKKQS